MKLQFVKVNRRGKRPFYRAAVRVSKQIAYQVATFEYSPAKSLIGVDSGTWWITWNDDDSPCLRDSRKHCEESIRARLLATLVQSENLQLITEEGK